MKIKAYLFYSFLFFFVSSAWAAEIRVSPGSGTLAAAVAAASDGDMLVLEDGGFSGSVTLNKSLTIRPVNRATNAVVSNGTISINGSGIKVTVQGLKFSVDLTLVNADAVRLLENEWLSGDIECANYSSATGDGSLVVIGNRLDYGSIKNIKSDGAYIAGNVLLNGSVRSDSYVWIVGNQIINNDVGGAIYTGGTGNVLIIANRVRCDVPFASNYKCIDSVAPSTFIAGNVVEVNDTNSSIWQQRAIYATSGHATVINNVIRGMPANATRSTSAIEIASPGARIAGNIVIDYVTSANAPITVTSPSAEVTHNLCFNNSGNCPTGDGNLNADPLFIDLDDYQLATGSPAIDAGPPDPGMADLDRTRNDMGPQGGPWSIAQYDAQRDPDNYAPYVYPLFNIDSILSGGILEIQALGVARLR